MCTFNAHTVMDVAEMPNRVEKNVFMDVFHLVCDGLNVCVHSMYSRLAADIVPLLVSVSVCVLEMRMC